MIYHELSQCPISTKLRTKVIQNICEIIEIVDIGVHEFTFEGPWKLFSSLIGGQNSEVLIYWETVFEYFCAKYFFFLH